MNSKNLLLLIILLGSITAKAQFSRLQIINNCADQSYGGFDIYVDGTKATPPTFNDLFFRTSTAFFDVPAGSSVEIGIADQNSFDIDDTFHRQVFTFNQSNTYIIVINGIESTSGYSPAQPFSLDVYSMAKEAASIGQTEALFMNGSTDAPTMDIRTGLINMADDISYGSFSGYTQLSSSTDYKFRTTNPAGTQITNNFDAPLSTSSVDGLSITVLTSGFVNPGNNSNGPAYGLWMSVSTGGALIELQSTNIAEALARVQFIHNTADTAVKKVDIYVDNQKTVDTLDYHYATEYMDVYANTALNVGLAHSGNTTQFFNQNITFDSGKVYTAVVHGLESDTNYKPLQQLEITTFDGAKEESSSTYGEAILLHACTDGPVIRARDVAQAAISQFASLDYGDFSTGYYTIKQSDALRVDTGSNQQNLENYAMNAGPANFANKTVTLTYSGFMVPDSNSGGPKFGVWAALPEGGKMVELPVYTNINQITKTARDITIWPNPATKQISFKNDKTFEKILIVDVTGKVINQYNNYKDNSISIRELSGGTYFLLLQSGEKIYKAQFIKQ